MKIKGFNSKEQACFDMLVDGRSHSIKQMKELFEDAIDDAQAQSFVRNSIRRLVRDGWVEKCARGTYRLSRIGKVKIGKDIAETASMTNGRRRRKKGNGISHSLERIMNEDLLEKTYDSLKRIAIEEAADALTS